jgi:acetyltransferase-like isoleucine patch superfamily enzyme
MASAKLLEAALSAVAVSRARMRAHLMALRGAAVGAKVGIGPRCNFDRPWCVRLGSRVVLESDVFLKMAADGSLLELGDFVFLGRGVEFDVTERVSVGSNTVIAPRCFITDHNHGIAADRRIDQQGAEAAPVVIGSDVWLGAGVVVLPGVTIGDGAVVGANSVVTKDVAPMTIVAGCPARILRTRTNAVFPDHG